jgi:diacylglycerol kinase family enzyme
VLPRVDVIVNRRARHLGEDAGARASLVRAAEGRARVHETRSLADLEAVVRSLAGQGTDAVILAGGDGSYMAGTTALFRIFGAGMPRIGFAPGGTVGTVARNWGMRGSRAGYAAQLLRAVAADKARLTRRPTLRVQDDTGADRVGFIFGAGLVANFFDAYYASGWLGYGAAAILVARIFAGSFYGGELASRVLTPTPGVLVVDGDEILPRAFSLVAASVVRNLGLHMIVLHRAGERSDRFHVVASPLPARSLGPQLPRVLLGKRLNGADHVDALAREVELSFPGGASSYVLDGEVFKASRVRISAGPVLDYLST